MAKRFYGHGITEMFKDAEFSMAWEPENLEDETDTID